jgi:FkbM family methyltransferase
MKKITTALKFFFRQLFSKFLERKNISRIVLSNLDPQKVRTFYGNDFLAPIQAFANQGYTQRLYEGLHLIAESQVLILGGYKGDSTLYLYNKFNCYITVLEPIEEYSNEIDSRINHPSKVRIERCAASSNNSGLLLNLGGERTSQFVKSDQIVRVESRDISSIVREMKQIDLLEMNIEGGEYEVLNRLISTRDLTKVSTILVQFHNYGLISELERSKLRNLMNETHENIFTFDWVWERWDRRKND